MALQVPHDEFAERSYLATLSAPGMEDDAYLMLPMIAESDLLVPGHQAWYKALCNLSESRSEINCITIWNAMEGDKRKPDRFTFDSWLMADEVGRPQVLADIIKRHARSRKLMSIGHHLEKEAGTTLDPVMLASRVQDALGKIGANDGNTTEGAGSILDRLAAGEALGPADGGSSLFQCGIEDLDNHIEGAPGHIVVIGARPKCGKSALLTQGVLKCAKQYINTMIVSLEMDQDEVFARLASHITGRDHLDYRRGRYNGDDIQKISDNKSVLDRVQTWVGTSGMPYQRIEAEIRSCVRLHGVRVVFVDYLQLVAFPIGKGETLAQAIGKVSQSFKRLAQELRICVVLLSQINREGGKGSEPSVEDLKGSGDIEQDANAIIMLWRNNKDELHVKIAANRSGPAGYRQTVEFDGATSTFRQGSRLVEGASVPQLGPSKAQALLQKHTKPVGFLDGFM